MNGAPQGCRDVAGRGGVGAGQGSGSDCRARGRGGRRGHWGGRPAPGVTAFPCRAPGWWLGLQAGPVLESQNPPISMTALGTGHAALRIPGSSPRSPLPGSPETHAALGARPTRRRPTCRGRGAWRAPASQARALPPGTWYLSAVDHAAASANWFSGNRFLANLPRVARWHGDRRPQFLMKPKPGLPPKVTGLGLGVRGWRRPARRRQACPGLCSCPGLTHTPPPKDRGWG